MLREESDRLPPNLSACFIVLAVSLLATTAIAKIIAASGEARILGQADPLFGLLSMRQSMLMAAALEILVVVLVLQETDWIRKAGLLLWLGAVFLVYRIALWWVGFEGSCRCLGNLGDVFGIRAETADWIGKGILVYLLVGSFAILLWHRRHRGNAPDADGAVQVGTETKLSLQPEAGESRG